MVKARVVIGGISQSASIERIPGIPSFIYCVEPWRLFDDHPKAAINSRYGIPDRPERVHWETEMAARVGVSIADDCGPERCPWLGHAITNWIGDDGMLRKLYGEIRRQNLECASLYIGRSVTRILEENNGEKLVEIDLLCMNQDSERSAHGKTVSDLPSRNT